VNLLEVLNEIENCTACPLHAAMPFKPVPGIGNNHATIMLIGEAPGAEESIIEEPFVGQAGRMLDKLLEAAGLDRASLYVSNLVKCRPCNGNKNRAPTQKEIKACNGLILKEILAVKPQVIFTLGKLPTFNLLKLKSTDKLTNYIGKEIVVDGYTIIPNFHPSYIMQYGKKEMEMAIEVFKIGHKYLT